MRLSAIKPLLTAAVALLALAGGSELFLRLREPDGFHQDGSGLSPTEPSDTVHHRLRVLTSLQARDPDTGTDFELRVNSHGLRGDEVTVPKPPGVIRVLCLGDETVFGAELTDNQTLVGRLKESLQGESTAQGDSAAQVEAVNGGVPGDCPLLSWLRLRHSLLGLQPDLVVLHFDMSDVADDRRYRRDLRVDAAGVPIACPHPDSLPLRKPAAWWRDLRLTTAALELAGGFSAPSIENPTEIYDRRAATAWLRDNPPDWSPYVDQALAPIEEIHDAVDRAGAVLVVSTCPQPWQVSGTASDGPGVRAAAGVARGAVLTNRGPFDAIAAFVRRRGIPYCDVTPAFAAAPSVEGLYFRNSPNLSQRGQALYARVLSEFIVSKLSLPSPSRRAGRSPELVEDQPGPAGPVVPAGAWPDEPPRYR